MEANPHHYVEMAEFGLLQESDGGESSTSGWGAVSNLDQFFSTMYSYYYSKGLPTMCVTGVTNLLTLGFTIVLSTCLFALVDYAALLECRDESSCHALGDYVTREMLSRYPVRGALAMCYFALFFAYWAWSAVSLALSLRDAAEMHRFFVERLGVSTRELQTMTWHEVVERVVRLQESGEYKIAIHRRALSAHDIACRVMRKENYLIAFINQGILALHGPVPRALARLAGRPCWPRCARRRDRAGRGRDARERDVWRVRLGTVCASPVPRKDARMVVARVHSQPHAQPQIHGEARVHVGRGGPAPPLRADGAVPHRAHAVHARVHGHPLLPAERAGVALR